MSIAGSITHFERWIGRISFGAFILAGLGLVSYAGVLRRLGWEFTELRQISIGSLTIAPVLFVLSYGGRKLRNAAISETTRNLGALLIFVLSLLIIIAAVTWIVTLILQDAGLLSTWGRAAAVTTPNIANEVKVSDEEKQQRVASFLQRWIQADFRVGKVIVPGSPISTSLKRLDELKTDSEVYLGHDPRLRARLLSCVAYGQATCLKLDLAIQTISEAETLVQGHDDWIEEKASLESARSLVLALAFQTDEALKCAEAVERLLPQVEKPDTKAVLEYQIALCRTLVLGLSGPTYDKEKAAKLGQTLLHLENASRKLPGACEDQWLFALLRALYEHPFQSNVFTWAQREATVFVALAQAPQQIREVVKMWVKVAIRRNEWANANFDQKRIQGIIAAYNELLTGLRGCCNSTDELEPSVLFAFAATEFGGFLMAPQVAKYEEANEIGEQLFAYVHSMAKEHPFLVTIRANQAVAAYQLSLRNRDVSLREKARDYANWAIQHAKDALDLPKEARYVPRAGEPTLKDILKETDKTN